MITIKKLFLIDGFGALVSAFFHGILLVAFQEYFGIPSSILIGLSVIACVFAAYSFSCFFFLKRNYSLFLKGIAIANTLFCVLTIGLLIFYYNQITLLGLLYFILEIFIVMALVKVEFLVAKKNIA